MGRIGNRDHRGSTLRDPRTADTINKMVIMSMIMTTKTTKKNRSMILAVSIHSCRILRCARSVPAPLGHIASLGIDVAIIGSLISPWLRFTVDTQKTFELKLKRWKRKNRNKKHSYLSDKPREAFRGQSRSPNMIPFHMFGMVSYN